jgi:hypothetical protein
MDLSKVWQWVLAVIFSWRPRWNLGTEYVSIFAAVFDLGVFWYLSVFLILAVVPVEW